MSTAFSSPGRVRERYKPASLYFGVWCHFKGKNLIFFNVIVHLKRKEKNIFFPQLAEHKSIAAQKGVLAHYNDLFKMQIRYRNNV